MINQNRTASPKRQIEQERIEGEMNLPFEREHEADELALYWQRRIPDHTQPAYVDLSAIMLRETQKVVEKVYCFPQNIFFIEWDGNRAVGRKLVSESRLQGRLLELHCSGITPSMLLGLYAGEFADHEAVRVSYYPFSDGEKLTVFEQIKDYLDAELVYPFRYIDQGTHQERTSPKEGWSLNPTRAANLGLGEEHLRAYTIAFLRYFDMSGKIVYDPACSTGQFLHTIKTAFPDCYTIGQDLSRQMTDYAGPFVDEIHTGDASISFIPDESVDYAFCRFLNSEVVNTAQAQELFPKIAARVKPGGYLIVFGHTPVLLSRSYFEAQGLQVLHTLAYDRSLNILFQYYVLRKQKRSRSNVRYRRHHGASSR